MFDLSGRVALVTGAGQGMGVGVVEALARQGATVAVNDLHPDRADAVANRVRGAIAAPFDVTDHAAVVAGMEGVAEAVGPVDILVNNAGVPADGFVPTPFRDTTPADWHRFVDLNLHGVLHCMHAALPSMCDRGWGRIVTVSSEAGRTGINLGVSLYGAGKAGALGLMRHVAVEVARTGVTVNAVALGLMDNVPSEWAQAVARTVPVGRLGSPQDVGAAVVFLASDEAGWITGQVLPVNGGAAT